MKIQFFALLAACSAVGATAARAAYPNPWPGVVAIMGGTATGTWNPAGHTPATPDSGRMWEQMEKMTLAEQLRRQALPQNVMQPDDKGRSLFVVAPGAGWSGSVVDAAAGRVEILGAAVENSVVRLGKGGRVVARQALLAGFHVIESTVTEPGGEIELQHCAVTGAFGGGYWGGQQHWRLEDCHFKDCRLPWMKAGGAAGASAAAILRCHFEDCFIPESFLLHCEECTFDGCTIGEGESYGRMMVFELDECGEANTVPARRSGAVRINVRKMEVRPAFWSAWTLADDGGKLQCAMANPRRVEPILFGSKPDPSSPAAPLTDGKAYRRLDAAGQLSFAGGTVSVQEKGRDLGDSAFQINPDRTIEWTETAENPDGPAPGEKPDAAPRHVVRQGVFSPDGQWLILGGTDNKVIGSSVRLFQSTSSMMIEAAQPGMAMLGTTWVLEGPAKYWIRFESTSQMSWMSDSGSERGSSLWKPLRVGQGLDLPDWQGKGASVIPDPSLTTFRVVMGNQSWHGKLVRREGTGVLPELKPGGLTQAAPGAVADVKKPTNENTPAGGAGNPDKAVEPAPPAGPVPPVVPVAPAGAGLSQPSGLIARTSRINGLLVMQLPGGKMAGATSRMNAAAIPAPGRGEATLNFNQEIGPMMAKALQEVRKFQTIRQGHWPECYSIEISFADKYSPKDGPSAAVACALLVEGLYTGASWDEALAVTGDLNADGSVQPVGGVPAKIRGAVGRKCRIIGIPAGNERAVRDLLVGDGPSTLLSINIFSLKEFDQARDLAMLARPAGLATALLEFDKVIKAAPPKEQTPAWVRQPAVAAQLRKVVAAAPHHLSARLLLDYAEGRANPVLSLAGSLEAIDREGEEVMQAIRVSVKQQNLTGIKKDGLGDALLRLRRLRAQMHPETRPLVDSMESFSKLVRAYLGNPPRTAAFINKAVAGIQAAGSLVEQKYRDLKANPEVMAELMKE